MKSLIVVALLCLSGLSAQANVLGDMQTFAPNSDGLDFITVHTSRPLTEGFWAVGGHLSYAKDHLVVFDNLNSQNRYNYKDQLVEIDLDVSYAITNKFSAFFAAPTLLYHQSDAGQVQDVQISRGVHTYRPGFKWTLGSDSNEFAVIGSIDILNVTNSPYTGVSPYNIYNIELAKTLRASGRVTYGFNVGYRFRKPTATPSDADMFPLKDQFTFSAGRSAPAWGTSRWVLEGIFSVPVDRGHYKRTVDASSADILLGFKHRLLKRLNFDWGGTVEPVIDTQSPRFRVFAGLVYYFNPGWSSNQDKEQVPPPEATAPFSESEVANLPAENEAAEDETLAGQDNFPLKISPQSSEVFEGTMVHFQVSGGEAPYSYKVVTGSGRFSTKSIYYRAPSKPERAIIKVIDAKGNSEVAEVVVKVAPEPKETLRLKNLNFIFNTDKLIKTSQAEVNRIIGLFKGKNVSSIIVEGHTDSKGSAEYNEELSEKRAAAVARILIRGLGLRADQVTAIGYGESRPVATNKTEKGRLLNRRVDLKMYYQKSSK